VRPALRLAAGVTALAASVAIAAILVLDPFSGGSEKTQVVESLRGINVSSALYTTEQGASESFADAVKTAEETDWAANYAGLKEFQEERIKAEGLADELVWLRLSGFQQGTGGADSLVTDDLIFFRIDTERGFLRVLAGSAETEDRAHLHSRVEGWMKTLVENVEAALPDAAAEDGHEDSALQETLRKMVLRREDVPTGPVQNDESFITNEELASSSSDSEARLALLEEWGRLLGYEVAYGYDSEDGG
jgi:hypothetical protein